MSLLNISIGMRTLLYSLVLITIFSSVCLFMIHLRQKRGAVFMGADVFLGLLGFFEFNVLCVSMEIRFSGDVYTDFRTVYIAWPLTRVMGIAVCAVLVCAFLILDMIRNRDRISPASIQESLDSVPCGLCYYFESGMPRLINRQMEAICRELFDRPLDHGGFFMERLEKGENTGTGECLEREEALIWRGKSGTIWSFSRQKIPYERTFLWEILAADITEEYEKSLSLKEKKERMLQINRRLKIFSRNVTALSVEKETLAVKVRIHSQLGESLIGVRRYLESGDPKPEDFAREWENNLAMLTAAAMEEAREVSAEETARRAGIRLRIRGEGPADPGIRAAAEQALKECITNTSRHTDGQEVTAVWQHEGDAWMLEITNDGEAPKGEIVKGGGLKDLFSSVKAAGGEAQIISQPVFRLRLRFAAQNKGADRGGVQDEGFDL